MQDDQNSTERTKVDRFEKIYQATCFRLEGFVRSFIKREEAVHDVLQESYLRLWENMENVVDDHSVLPLLRTYATNIMINALRKSARELQRAHVFYSRQELTCSSEEDLDLKEHMQAYRQAVEALPPRRRQIYQMIQEEELTYKEIADKLNISTHTIKYHIGEARRALLNEFSTDKLLLAILLMALDRVA